MFCHSEELNEMELREALISHNGIGIEWGRPFRNTAAGLYQKKALLS